MSEPNARVHEFSVEGIAVNLFSMPQAVSAIVTAAMRTQSFCVFTLNLDHCAKLRSDRKFRNAYERARFVTADGSPIAMLARLSGVPLQRTAGSDLVWPLCAAASLHRLPIFLLGPNTTVLRKSEAQLSKHIHNLEIVGTYAPGPNFDPDSFDADVAIERIRVSGARLCFVAIGAPRQELFAARCLDTLPGVGLVCVGAALDFIAGTQARAPQFFQQHGLEWLWRLSSNPRRLGTRYLRSAAVMPRLAVGLMPQIISARIGPVS